jgi:hypothetical protein
VDVVIDKSYLQGASGDAARRLCDEHTVRFTETLFYELLTAPEQEERDACFAKLPARDSPVALIPRTGPLFRYEMEHLRAASPVVNHRIAVTFRFNPKLTSRSFHHSGDEEAALAEWRLEVGREVATFHEVATGVSAWCPPLETVSGQRLKSACEDLKRQACADTQAVRTVYRSLCLEGFPAASFLGPAWALFRWVQAHLLCSLDHVARYGLADLPNIPKRVENDIHDIQYLLFGALCGALATRDAEIAANFLLACPKGTLIT